jgi:very-short-patch-repair endonuclease
MVDVRVARLVWVQECVALRSQLHGLGITDDEVRARVAGGRWQWWGHHVVVLHNAGLTRRQLMWACVLDAGPTSALASHTALELAGFQPFATEAVQVHLLVSRGMKVCTDPAVVVHESRRVEPDRHIRWAGLPCTPVERSAIDAAAWQRWPRFACATLAAVVQQRLTTADRLEVELGRVGRVRHKAHLRAALADIGGGAQALSELDLVALCRRFRLQQPTKQRRRRDPHGKLRYLDAEWVLPDGSVLVLEVDGGHHLEVEHWQEDIRRERAVVISGRRVLRATSTEVRVEPGQVAADLRLAGVPSCQKRPVP